MRYWVKFVKRGGPPEWQEVDEHVYRDSVASLDYWLARDGSVPEWADGMEFVRAPDDWQPPAAGGPVTSSFT
jgi:hypothetical protein